MLASGTTFMYRDRERHPLRYFQRDEELVYCTDVKGLFEAMGCTYNAEEWRLFIDSSKRSLKYVLLHKGNKLASIPVGHSVHLKESYETMKELLRKKKSMQMTVGLCAEISRSFQCYLVNKQVLRNIHAFCVYGTVEQGTNIGYEDCGLLGKALKSGRKTSRTSRLLILRKCYFLHCTLSWD